MPTFGADRVDLPDVIGEFGALDDNLACWCSSSLLMQRMSVDLPEPDGPQMTMRSPRATVRLTFRSTWNSPYHLLTPIIWMAGRAFMSAMDPRLSTARPASTEGAVMVSPERHSDRPRIKVMPQVNLNYGRAAPANAIG